MKDRNHLAEVKTTNKVEIITKGVVDIPMLQILSAEGELIEKAVEPDLSKEEALKILKMIQIKIIFIGAKVVFLLEE